MEMEGGKCRISRTRPQRNGTEGLISKKNSFAEDPDLGRSANNLTNEHRLRISPHPQANQLPAWTLARLPPLWALYL